jgi:probable rRNA maturation factor
MIDIININTHRGEMEKDGIEIQSGKVSLGFFYTDELVSSADISLYEYWLDLTAKAIDSSFYNGEKPISINISIAGDAEIREINAEHRDKDKVTDVLSFPMQDDMRGGDFDDFMPEIELGDIIVCKSVCEEQAKEFELSYFEEFVHLVIHGFLHIYGYDHEISEKEEKIMFDLEEELVKEISELKQKKTAQ